MARHPPETRYAQSSGAKIAYQVSGTGRPDLAMVPGLVSHLDIQWQQAGYRRFVRALERGGRLIQLDKHGTGASIDFGAKGYGNLVELASLQQHVAERLGRPAGRLLMMVKSAHVYETERVYLQGVLAGAAGR